jgi:hypothetical protein
VFSQLSAKQGTRDWLVEPRKVRLGVWDRLVCGRELISMAKGQEKPGKTNKPKVTTKAKQAKKAEKKAAAS